MHKFLMNIDGDSWAFLQQYSKQSGRTVAGTIRLLVNDLREKELYGKDGLFSDLPFPEEKEKELSDPFSALRYGQIVYHVEFGKGHISKVDVENRAFSVWFDDTSYPIWFDNWEEDKEEFTFTDEKEGN